MRHRTFDFDVEGRVTTERARPMVSATLRDAISNVAAAFRQRGRASPFHVQNGVPIAGSLLHPKITALLQGFGAADPPPNRQKAATPALLKDMRELAMTRSKGIQHTTSLIIGGYFFAMRACEFCNTGRLGRTRRLTVENVTFRDESSQVVNHTDPLLGARAMFVTICFVNQKNGTKMEKRSHRRSGVSGLCPVEAWVEVIARLRVDFDTSDHNAWRRTTVCSFSEGGSTFEVRSENVIELLRNTCRHFDGENKYGIAPEELGTRSIRSGAAMALSLQKGNSDRKIMMLGRWKSLAFLSYIRPQVLEWAGGMAGDMARTIPFLDVGGSRIIPGGVSEDQRYDRYQGTEGIKVGTTTPTAPQDEVRIEHFRLFGL